ncbi:MAG: aspartate carbamoyltransferase regulatory subunit, partial [Thaumarchaeota archaeon]|nr:aspartate carbamoyltransferase regulatory subunit [Nitrososphaerota archaeon]
MLVQKISDGTVIDHVFAGKALSVLRLLGNPQNRGVTVA